MVYMITGSSLRSSCFSQLLSPSFMSELMSGVEEVDVTELKSFVTYSGKCNGLLLSVMVIPFIFPECCRAIF